MSTLTPHTPFYDHVTFSHGCQLLCEIIESTPNYSDKNSFFSKIPYIHTLFFSCLVKKDGKEQLVSFGRMLPKHPFYNYSREGLEKVLKTALYYFAKRCEIERITPIKLKEIETQIELPTLGFKYVGGRLPVPVLYPHIKIMKVDFKDNFHFKPPTPLL